MDKVLEDLESSYSIKEFLKKDLTYYKFPSLIYESSLFKFELLNDVNFLKSLPSKLWINFLKEKIVTKEEAFFYLKFIYNKKSLSYLTGYTRDQLNDVFLYFILNYKDVFESCSNNVKDTKHFYNFFVRKQEVRDIVFKNFSFMSCTFVDFSFKNLTFINCSFSYCDFLKCTFEKISIDKSTTAKELSFTKCSQPIICLID